jgi:SnoaL-like domain
MIKITALAVGLALICLPAALAESAFEREYKDRVEIEKVMWQYTRGLDTLNADAYVATFTPDGQFGVGERATKGHEALRKMITDLAKRNAETEAKTGKKPPAMYHTAMNPYLEFVDKDHAILLAYWTTTFAGAAPGEPARIAAVGWERNELVRVNGKWLIQIRDTAPKDRQ